MAKTTHKILGTCGDCGYEEECPFCEVEDDGKE